MPHDEPRPTALQRRSAALLVLFSRVPRWLLLVVVLGVTIGGLLLENAWGAALLLLLALFLAWLAVLGWPRLSTLGRVLRLLVVGLVVYFAISRLI